MKVLLVNHTLDIFAGSETFTYTLAVELRRLGHQVVCFSRRLGPLAEQLRASGVAVTNDLATVGDDIDVIHGHHRHESLLAYARFPDKPMIFVCHGILPPQEQPLRSTLNIFRYVAVSEEIKAHLIENHSIEPEKITVIRNGIDLARFCCRRPVEFKPRRALIISNYMPRHERSVIREACERLDIRLTAVGGPHMPIWDVENHINQADLVFSLGRGALEAMACKRGVIVFDYHGADGLVTPENFQRLREKNFSGRAQRLQYGTDDLLKEIESYHPSIPEKLFEYVKREHNIQTVARCYVQLYESALNGRSASLAYRNWGSVYLAVKEVLDDLERKLHVKQQQLSKLREENERLRIFSDAVRRTWLYRVYRTLSQPFRSR